MSTSNARVGAIVGAALALLGGAGAAYSHEPGALPEARAAAARVTLHGCWMTVGLVPRPLTALERALRRPLEPVQTFYGSEPLAGVWALRCARARLGGTDARGVVLSLVAAPRALTRDDAPPLANFFDHALLRVDTSSRRLARLLERNGVAAAHAPGARYRHAASAEDSSGTLELPGLYRLRVRAGTLDPTNPHDHLNRFAFRAPDGAGGTIDLRTTGAADRFCFVGTGNCSVSVIGRSPGMRRVLGDATPRAGFDHERIARLELVVRRVDDL